MGVRVGVGVRWGSRGAESSCRACVEFNTHQEGQGPARRVLAREIQGDAAVIKCEVVRAGGVGEQVFQVEIARLLGVVHELRIGRSRAHVRAFLRHGGSSFLYSDDSNYRVRCAVGPTDGPEKEKEKSKKK